MKLTEVFLSANLSKKEIGDRGEELAARYMKKNGYKILERNYYVHRVGELDIIARDGEYLCFVEVRLRSHGNYGTPAETVTREKRRLIVRTAKHYLLRKGLENSYIRFDVVEVYGTDPGSRVELIKDAFWADE